MPAIETASVSTRISPVVTAPRLDFLDALRGIAALLVVVQHVGERYISWMPGFAESWFGFGRFGVTVFFLVSGFVIPYACEKDKSAQSFWIKRFFRLYPLYWLSLALTVAANIEPVEFHGPHLVRNILVNITMLQGFFGIPNASAPFWTLGIEMAFYLTFTVWYLLNLHRKTLLWAWLGVAAFFTISILAPLLLGAHAPVTKVFCFLAILVGSAFYRTYNRQISASSLGILITTVILLAAAASYLNFFKFPSSEHISATSVFLSWTAAFLIFTAFFALRTQKFPRFLLGLGKISYSLYLLHAIVLDGTPSIDFALTLFLSLAISILSFRYLETPFISFGHRLAKVNR